MMALRCYGSLKKHRLEGIVSKKREAPYRSGPCRDWRKIKTADWKAATGSGGTVRAALASPLSCVTPIPLGHLDLDDVIDKAVASKSVCQARRSPRPGGLARHDETAINHGSEPQSARRRPGRSRPGQARASPPGVCRGVVDRCCDGASGLKARRAVYLAVPDFPRQAVAAGAPPLDHRSSARSAPISASSRSCSPVLAFSLRKAL